LGGASLLTRRSLPGFAPQDDEDWLVLLLDGKSFADDQVVSALGVTTTGEPRILGLVQTATENKRVCAACLRELVDRGFQTPSGLLVVLDGAKGLSAAVRDVFGERVPIQRGQWHKREHVLSDLPKTHHARWRRQLQAAEAKAPYGEARHALRPLVKEREPHNGSAARSLEAGLDETLTLPCVEMFTKLGISVKTTNLIERVMARVEAQTHRITRWRTSDQKQRWCAATLHDIEKQFRKVQGHQPLALLHAALGGKLSSSALQQNRSVRVTRRAGPLPRYPEQ
jgi:transposase-like protein